MIKKEKIAKKIKKKERAGKSRKNSEKYFGLKYMKRKKKSITKFRNYQILKKNSSVSKIIYDRNFLFLRF